ncbi:MAG: dTDP-4-dehydrorhamnose 3,5-epimerase [Rickettsiales bacterium TMED289]|nr:MAG: dTDP-4-dehydrorhamnose 3,5-epimerase [Rickettsiales bacterium TMED289]|tara:strand:- start:3064 stop:3606 length:543 start_codon:yes stop_codon:yes gene_type:complete
MEIKKTRFGDLFLIKHYRNFDERGSFSVINMSNILSDVVSYKFSFCQDNIVNSKKMVLRGLHFQKFPYAQSKLVSVIKGKILDIAVDLRKESPTFGNYFSHELTSNDDTSIFIPRGFAHGYLTLENNTIIHYKVDNYYEPSSEVGINFNDPFLNINWKVELDNLIISDKDLNHKSFDWSN